MSVVNLMLHYCNFGYNAPVSHNWFLKSFVSYYFSFGVFNEGGVCPFVAVGSAFASLTFWFFLSLIHLSPTPIPYSCPSILLKFPLPVVFQLCAWIYFLDLTIILCPPFPRSSALIPFWNHFIHRKLQPSFLKLLFVFLSLPFSSPVSTFLLLICMCKITHPHYHFFSTSNFLPQYFSHACWVLVFFSESFQLYCLQFNNFTFIFYVFFPLMSYPVPW